MQRFLAVAACLAYANAKPSFTQQGRRLNEGQFLNKAINKGCCAAQACKCLEVNPTPLELNLHEHSYCHLDTTPKYARKTVWEERKVQGTRPVLVDEKKTMKKTVIDYKLEEVPSIKHGTKVVQRTKTRTVPSSKVVYDLVPFKVKVKKMVPRMTDETYKVMETRYKEGTRVKKQIRMVPKTMKVKDVVYDKTTSTKKVSKWINKPLLAKVRVPQSTVNNDPIDGADDCPCFKKLCDCIGQAGCGCCQPSCSCAPSMPSAKTFETVQVLTETAEEIETEEPLVTETPRIIEKELTVEVPEEFDVIEKYQIPYTVEVTKTRQVPVLEEQEVEQEEMRRQKKTVAFEQVEEYTVDETVPYSEPVTTQVQVPFTRESEVEVIQKIAKQQAFTLVIKAPKETIEKLPPSTVCHEHKYQHSHALNPGETHSHSEEHSHPHAGDGSDFEGRIIEPSDNPVLGEDEAKNLGVKTDP